MNRLALASFTTLVVASGIWVACSNSGASSSGLSDAGAATDAGVTDATAGDAGLQPAVPCTDSIASVYGDPGPNFAALAKGAIIRCAHDTDIPLATLRTMVTNNVSTDTAPIANTGYVGKPLTSGVHIYRVLYRTERGDSANSPGYSSAELLIPDTPRAPDLPILVASHGARGQGSPCVASQENDAGWVVNGDYEALGLPLAGLGDVVLLPDLAGYSNYGAPGNPPSAFADSEDVGKSTLDGARALANLLTTGLSNKVVLVGHSQGGSTTLSGVALASSYAPDLNVVAAATYAPLWLSEQTWAALLYPPEADEAQYALSALPFVSAIDVWYHYSHSMLLDGPDAGLETFAAGKAAQIVNFFNNDCWGEWGDLQEAGTTADDLFDPGFVSSIGQSAALGSPCGSDTTCATWIARYAADRPHLKTSIPILIEYGAQDETIPADRMACVIQRLGPPSTIYPGGDNVNMTFCLDPALGHQGVVRAHASDVADWIAAQTLGEPQPPPCQYNQNNLVENEAGVPDPADDAGTPISCAVPPPNTN